MFYSKSLFWQTNYEQYPWRTLVMLREIIGEKTNAIAAEALLSEMSKVNQNGILYIGYPNLPFQDSSLRVDALLITLEHGVVVFDFMDNYEDNSIAEITDRQYDLYAALHQILFDFKPLRNGRKLAIDINVITLSPDPYNDETDDEVNIISYQTIAEFVQTLSPISEENLKSINAAVQRITTLNPANKRLKVKKEESKGSIMKRIEKEIANLDFWQNSAAIETPKGPQRIRGLAGSGKTIVLALKASFLHVNYPEWKICVTFQTRSLYQQFRELIRRFTYHMIKDEPIWENMRVLHAWGSVHNPGLYSDFAQSIGHEPKDFTYAKREYGYDEAFRGVCSDLLHNIQEEKIEPLYDAILIDEAQDFPKEFFEISYLACKKPKRIIWAYDELQNLGKYIIAPPDELFGNKSNGRPRIPELRNRENSPKEDIVLPVCYRNTPWALVVAHALGLGIYRDGGLVQYFNDENLWDDIGYEIIEGSMQQEQYVEISRKSNSSPSYFNELLKPEDSIQLKTFTSPEQQLNWLTKSIQQNLQDDELDMRDILVIIADPINARKRSASIINALDDLGIPSHLAGVDTSKDKLFYEDSIAISGIYRAKGNEAPMVYLIDSEYCYAGLELIKRRNILFTAITRSKAWIRISGCGEDMKKLSTEIKKVIKNEYKLCFNVPTDEELEHIRELHKDLSPKEKKSTEKITKNISDAIEMIEKGEVSINNLDPELRDKLKELFMNSK